MKSAHTAELCQVLARFADVVEALAEGAGARANLPRLHNIRHDTLKLLASVRQENGGHSSTASRSWYRRGAFDAGLPQPTSAQPLLMEDLQAAGHA